VVLECWCYPSTPTPLYRAPGVQETPSGKSIRPKIADLDFTNTAHQMARAQSTLVVAKRREGAREMSLSLGEGTKVAVFPDMHLAPCILHEPDADADMDTGRRWQ